MAMRLIDSVLYHSIALTIERNGQIFNKTLTNVKVKKTTQNNDSIALIGKALYIRLGPVRAGFSRIVQTFIEEIDSTPLIILDLQSCVGGQLDEICNVASLFLKPGDTICIPRYMNPIHPNDYKATYPNPLRHKQIVVLISERTASGAEVITVALRTHAKAKIIGRKSLGYCDIDMAKRLSNNRFICRTKLGELYGADGLRISKNGIEPDIKTGLDENAVELALKEVKKE
jgi:carboxyl-terminal processing protease